MGLSYTYLLFPFSYISEWSSVGTTNTSDSEFVLSNMYIYIYIYSRMHKSPECVYTYVCSLYLNVCTYVIV